MEFEISRQMMVSQKYLNMGIDKKFYVKICVLTRRCRRWTAAISKQPKTWEHRLVAAGVISITTTHEVGLLLHLFNFSSAERRNFFFPFLKLLN